MADYAKKKNDELANLCKERGLPHTGKKADLVKRLEDHDAQGTGASTNNANPDDEIDWDEPAAEPSGAAAIAAGGIGEVANPLAVPNQVQAEDFTHPTDATVPAPAVEAPKEVKEFSAGISETSLDAEIEKRKARARRFGLPEDSEEIKILERAKRFGTSDLPGLLNKALPAGLDRKREGGEHDGGIRKRSRGRPGPGRGRGRGGGGGGGDRPKPTESRPAAGSWMTDDDRKKAEARKARFAKAEA